MSFFVHEMEYRGGLISESIQLRNYKMSDYPEYKTVYEDSFCEMRASLGMRRECCKSSDELLSNQGSIFILEENGHLIGSVAVYGNEIDDLFVAYEYRGKGYGQKLLRYAVSDLQKRNAGRIVLHVADVNKAAMSMYGDNGFIIVSTEEILARSSK